MWRWGAVACEFVSSLLVQWTEQMRTSVARCKGLSMVHMGWVSGATGRGGSGTRDSFARGSSHGVHGASEDRLCLGVGGAENADMLPGTILI
jgi:hypothetical protein